jgi:hypothetical protein
VGNSGTFTITPSNPLETTLDVSSRGPTSCAAGDIQYDGLKPQFRFEGYVGECKIDVRQPWIKKITQDRVCLHVRNDNASDGCPMRAVGMSVTVYKRDGVSTDPNYKITRIEGGAISATTSCGTNGKLVLFEPGCNAGAPLQNGQRWDFRSGGSCGVPMAVADPGEYFVVNNIDLTGNVAGTGRRIDVTIHYRCANPCSDVAFSRTFQLKAPQ